MVGTAYLRPSPEAKPFVEVGSMVKAGDKLLLVEAMKTFNDIVALAGRQGCQHPRRRRRAGRVRPAADGHRVTAKQGYAADFAGYRGTRLDVRQDPDRQPGRNRAARDARGQGARHRHRRGLFDRRQGGDARQARRRERLHRAARPHATAISTSPRSSRPARSPAPTPFIPATAFCPRTRVSPIFSKSTRSPSSAPRPNTSA